MTEFKCLKAVFMFNFLEIKGNSQFLFLCNPQRSGASRVCISFPQITQKINLRQNSLAGTDHWNSKLSTNIQCGNNKHSAFLIFQKICKKINKKTIFLTYFGPLKANYR